MLPFMQPQSLTNAKRPSLHTCDMGDADLIQTLTASFNALSDEVQSLIDRKTILEHKLRYAHEQVCYQIHFVAFSPTLS